MKTDKRIQKPTNADKADKADNIRQQQIAFLNNFNSAVEQMKGWKMKGET